jgi:hypothetical protein
MPTRTGPTAPAEDLTALLLDGHGRIRSVVALATTLAEASEPDPADVAETARRVGRGFGEALALHARDEEESILPRLAGRDRDLDAALVTMHRDHVRQGPAADRLVALCAELEAAPARHRELAGPLGAAARALEDHLAGHLASEEGIVLPALGRFVGEDVQREIASELRARRGAARDHSSR